MAGCKKYVPNARSQLTGKQLIRSHFNFNDGNDCDKNADCNSNENNSKHKHMDGNAMRYYKDAASEIKSISITNVIHLCNTNKRVKTSTYFVHHLKHQCSEMLLDGTNPIFDRPHHHLTEIEIKYITIQI